MANKYLNSDGLSHLIDKLKASISKKVDKVECKALSTNDYTNDEKAKLQGVEAKATYTRITLKKWTHEDVNYSELALLDMVLLDVSKLE